MNSKNRNSVFLGVISVVAILFLGLLSGEKEVQEVLHFEPPVAPQELKPSATKPRLVLPQTKQVKSQNIKTPAQTLKAQKQELQQAEVKLFTEQFYRRFERTKYREGVLQSQQSGGAQFATLVSEELLSLDSRRQSGEFTLTQVTDFLFTCSTEEKSILPSFVQALCLRRLEKLSYTKPQLKSILEKAKKESHPAVQDLFGILSRKED